MAIKAFRQPPAEGEARIRQALRDLAPSANALGGAQIGISEPLPIFRLGLADLLEADALNRAEFVAWRYLLDGGGSSAAMADVGERPGGSTFFGSLARNEQADFLLQAAHLAQSEAGNAAHDCEVRILLVPALYACALWLTTDPPIFIPILDAEHPIRGVSEVRAQPAFLARLAARARQRAGPGSRTPSSMSGP